MSHSPLRVSARRLRAGTRVIAHCRTFSARYVTLALALVLTGVAAVIGWRAGSGPIVVLDLPDLTVFALLVVLFFLAEYSLLNVEFRREAHSVTLAGLPVMLAVLLAPPHTAVLARVLGALAALLLQRIEWRQGRLQHCRLRLRNRCQHARWHSCWSGPTTISAHPSSPWSSMVVMVVDQAMSALVLWIIRLHGGRARQATDHSRPDAPPLR